MATNTAREEYEINKSYSIGFKIGSGQSEGRLSKADQVIINNDLDSYERGLADGEASLEEESADNTYNIVTKANPTSFWKR